MKLRSLLLVIFLTTTASAEPPWYLNDDGSTTIEAERQIQRVGVSGLEKRNAASRGEVLGTTWGNEVGHFVELFFRTPEAITPATLRIRYARDLPGSGYIDLTLDSIPLGRVRYDETGGWGDKEEDFREIELPVKSLKANYHRLHMTIVADRKASVPLPQTTLPSSEILDLVGNRSDKNGMGHGKNLAIYAGRGARKRYFFATHELGNVFDAFDGELIRWYPDHALLEGNTRRANFKPKVNIDWVRFEKAKRSSQPRDTIVQPTDTLVVEQRQVCVTADDVAVCRVFIANKTKKAVTHRVVISGDSRNSFDWRERPTGERTTSREGKYLVVSDSSVFPDVFKSGLNMAIGGSIEPGEVDASTPGAYKLTYDIELKGGEARSFSVACAFQGDKATAIANLDAVLKDDNLFVSNRRQWEDFYTKQVPQFSCSNKELNELYGFRWFLLRFSTAGGDLGYFKYPVVMEGRQAYQTYCCYSAPFMAYDMNWATDPRVGFGHIANMGHAAYEDGRFPWYTSPRTNRVKLGHDSASGLSLLPHTAWRHFLIHGDKDLLAEIYPAMAKNMQWWIKDRDPNGDGLFDVSHQLETGQDDLFRWGEELREMRYDAVDASSYAFLNLSAVAQMARALGKADDAKRFGEYAEKTGQAINSALWNSEDECWYDRHPTTRKLTKDYLAITTFYPMFAGVGEKSHLGVFRKHLLNPKEFWLPHPVPALPKTHKDYDPLAFWEGPAWPAATSHVVEGFATAAKQHDRSLLPQAGELFLRAAANHTQGRADFFERYNPQTGHGLSMFRDYMHSWWIDLYIRHVAGLEIGADGQITIDPLPVGLTYFTCRNIPYRSKRLEILWRKPGTTPELEIPAGLTVVIEGKVVLSAPNFVPGEKAVTIR